MNENGNIYSRIYFRERFHLQIFHPMSYNSVMCAYQNTGFNFNMSLILFTKRLQNMNKVYPPMSVHSQLSTNRMLSYVILCQMIFMYRIFSKIFVLELSISRLLTDYNKDFSIEIFLWNNNLRKLKLLLWLLYFLH